MYSAATTAKTPAGDRGALCHIYGQRGGYGASTGRIAGHYVDRRQTQYVTCSVQQIDRRPPRDSDLESTANGCEPSPSSETLKICRFAVGDATELLRAPTTPKSPPGERSKSVPPNRRRTGRLRGVSPAPLPVVWHFNELSRATSNAMGYDVAAVPPVAPTPTIPRMFGAQRTRQLARYTGTGLWCG
jgi:hypothetical protein